MLLFTFPQLLVILQVLLQSAKASSEQTIACEVNYPWQFIGEGICFVVASPMTYHGARQYCRALGRGIDLPVLKDVKTINFVNSKMVAINKPNTLWLGAKRTTGVDFTWVDGTVLKHNDSKWYAGEPNMSGRCAALWDRTRMDKDGILHRAFDDIPCGNTKLTICSCKRGFVNISSNGIFSNINNTIALFKQSPLLAPYQDVFLKGTADGGNPVLELEKVGLSAAKDLLNSNRTDVNETVEIAGLMIRLSKYAVQNFKGDSFSSPGTTASVQLPTSIFEAESVTSTYAATVGIAYGTLSENNALQNKTTLNDSSVLWRLNSHVISYAVLYDQLNFSNPVVLTFQNRKQTNIQAKSTCAFWNTSTNSWSRNGCYKVYSDEKITRCHCYHLTTFASLLQVDTSLDSSQMFSPGEIFALNVVTYICFGLSYVGLLITIIFIVASRLLKKPNSVIHLNLSIAILLAQTTFIFGITATGDKKACKATAVLLHYLYLTVGTWMLAEGIYITRMTRSVFNINRNVVGYLALGWGVPALMVAVLFAVLNRSYGYDKACWLRRDNGAIWAFAAPMTVILSINLVVLVIAIKATLGIKVNRSKSEKDKIRVGIKAFIVLLPLLGLAWIFGLLAIGSAAKAMQIIFAILNALQGFFIFLFHCIRNPEIKKLGLFTRTNLTSEISSSKNKVSPKKTATT